jgi:hypothetical protein
VFGVRGNCCSFGILVGDFDWWKNSWPIEIEEVKSGIFKENERSSFILVIR